ELHRAMVGTHPPGGDLQQGGLADPVSAHQRRDTPWFHPKRGRRQNGASPEALPDALRNELRPHDRVTSHTAVSAIIAGSTDRPPRTVWGTPKFANNRCSLRRRASSRPR